MHPSSFRLNVQLLKGSCLFELSWADSQQLMTQLLYPDTLTNCYRQWQQAYLNYYKNYQSPQTTPHSSQPNQITGELRGRLKGAGSFSLQDRRTALVQAQQELLHAFFHWLRSPELYTIRAELARAAKSHRGDLPLKIFLSCAPIELERLPWEAWDIGQEFGEVNPIRLVRVPVNLKVPISSQNQPLRRRVRILAILGDDRGLNFEREQEALRSLTGIAELEFVGWQPGTNPQQLIKQIQTAIADPQGWDILFFAGHSNETILTGGQLAIAPGLAILVSEIAPQLQQAKARGLEFAIFNSCNGISIASALIELGLSQVTIMREPIHNQVAQVFFVQFLQNLAEHQDVHAALLATCEFLHSEHQLDYPSAHLIPSLFSHPESKLFQLQPTSWQKLLAHWRPRKREAIALATATLLSLLPPVQNLLLQGRILTQAVYRDLTGQVPAEVKPPVALVQIDNESIRRSQMITINPIDRGYLADLIDKLSGSEAQIIGINYLLDRPQPERDPILARSLRQAVTNKSIWFVFAAELNNGREIGFTSEACPDRPNWSLQGYTNASPAYLKLPSTQDCTTSCPFAYVLSVVYALNRSTSATNLPQPQLTNQTDCRTQLFDYLHQEQDPDPTISFLRQIKLHPVANLAETISQNWFRPINDFSLPPDLIYDSLPSWQLLQGNNLSKEKFKQRVVIIAPGDYQEAGVTPGSNNFPAPWAVKYWRERMGSLQQDFTGAEILAYNIYQLVNQRLVIPIPELLMIAIAGLIAKIITLHLTKSDLRTILGLASSTFAYSLIGWQIYLSAGILIPILLPSAVFWIYILPSLKQTQSHD